MNCKCISKIESEAKAKDYDNKAVLDAKVIDQTFILKDNSIDTVTCSHIELELQGLKRPKKVVIIHTYCPFCGSKIESE